MNKAKTTKVDKIICLASWEPRFLEGVQKDIQLTDAKECYLFFLEEFVDKSQDNITALEKFCAEKNIAVIKTPLTYSKPLVIKNIIAEKLGTLRLSDKILVDITTMTREIMWLILNALPAPISCAQYVYWKPEETAEWTSKNSSRPRLVIGRSGISQYGLPTLVAVTTGFDRSRLDQMIGYFEPEETILFLQEGTQFENHENNIRIHEGYSLGGFQVKECSIDSYSEDHGLKSISNYLNPYLETHNIVMASFGPKPSAIALHHFAQTHPEVALAYTPALDFNSKYSTGIGECVWGSL